MIRYLADWVLPVVEPPVQNGWVDVEQGRVVAVGSRASDGLPAGPYIDLGSTAILPALVNAHTHLELSGLRNTVPPAGSMPEWVSRLLVRRAEFGEPDLGAIRKALEEGKSSGTGLFGDISNTLATVPVLEAASTSACVFHEVLSFSDTDAIGVVEQALGHVSAAGPTTYVRLGLAAHAPYSVGPEVFDQLDIAIRGAFETPRCVHLAESPEELEFLLSGRGPWRTLLERFGHWNPNWEPPGCGPVEYLDRMGWLGPNVIVVHGVQLTDAELTRLAETGTTLVTCPRSNVWTGVGAPPIGRFIRSGVRLAVGTDSLASAPDLNLFAELALMRRCDPDVPARHLIACATTAGAAALGFADRFGRIEPGAPAALIGVRVPAGVSDVEEYLVGGIEPGQVCWLDQYAPRMPVD